MLFVGLTVILKTVRILVVPTECDYALIIALCVNVVG